MNEKNIKETSNLNIDIELSSPCVKCNGDCCECPYYNDNSDYASIEAVARAFRLSLNIDLKKHDHININL